MKLKDYLIDEMKRLNRMNDLLEKGMNQGIFIMSYEIANTLYARH